MKRTLSFILALTLMFSLTACGAPTSEPEASAEPTTMPSADQT